MTAYTPEFRAQIARLANDFARLLSGHPWQAGVMQALADAALAAPQHDLEKLYANGSIWGGMGSVFDVNLGTPGENEEACSLLVALVDQFEAAGFSWPPAAGRASICRQWLEDGTFRAPSSGAN